MLQSQLCSRSSRLVKDIVRVCKGDTWWVMVALVGLARLWLWSSFNPEIQRDLSYYHQTSILNLLYKIWIYEFSLVWYCADRCILDALGQWRPRSLSLCCTNQYSSGCSCKLTPCQGKQRKRITAESGSEGSGEAGFECTAHLLGGLFIHYAAVSVVVDPQRISKVLIMVPWSSSGH